MPLAADMPHANGADAVSSQPTSSGLSSGLAGWRPALKPLDVSAANGPGEAPSQPERLSRRESRLGLRNIFNRAKSARYPESPTSPRLPWSARENATQGIPYNSLPRGRPLTRSSVSRPLSIAEEAHEADPAASPTDAKSPTAHRVPPSPGNRVVKAQASSWSAVPLHKAYPEAIRYSTLPATTASADLILKFHEKRPAEDMAAPADANSKSKPRKRGRAKSGSTLELEWTTKTYILLPAGYLLEYAGDGPFDRSPDKALRLTKESAAFASDVIPGRHWVVQVASSMCADGTVTADPANPAKSFFSRRLPFRPIPEKRNASSMLLVFDTAEQMGGWLVALRRSIEALGGKKSLSETGKPKAEVATHLRAQASQQTLVVRDSDGDHPIEVTEGRDRPWDSDAVVRRGSETSDPTTSDTQRDESAADDTSATNSVISHDGRQLDSLRSSANRLSCVSSDQRTIVTSAASSPRCSPTADSFPQSLKEPGQPSHADGDASDMRPRPNATAILDRRQSLQTMSPFVELWPTSATNRPQSTAFGAPAQPGAGSTDGSSMPPNFSVPSTSSRRFSTRSPEGSPAASPTALGTEPPASPPPASPPTASTRRLPAALQVPRPLSMVVDQPSPKDDVPGSFPPEDSAPRRFGLTTVKSPPEGGQGPAAHRSPRRLSSMGALRTRASAAWVEVPRSTPEPPRMRPLQPLNARSLDPGRCHSSTDTYGHGEGMGANSSRTGVKQRMSMLPFVSGQPASGGGLGYHHQQLPPAPPAPPPGALPPLPGSLPAGMRIRPRSTAHGPAPCKSMPQVVEGPPPAPPPTCALPPIPKKQQSTPAS